MGNSNWQPLEQQELTLKQVPCTAIFTISALYVAQSWIGFSKPDKFF